MARLSVRYQKYISNRRIPAGDRAPWTQGNDKLLRNTGFRRITAVKQHG
jgi:hypothetical protein